MIKRGLHFFNIIYISMMIIIIISISIYQRFYMNNNLASNLILIFGFVFSLAVIVMNERMIKNIKYIKTGNIEDATDSILTPELKLVKQARLKQNVLFVSGEEKYFYKDNNYRVNS